MLTAGFQVVRRHVTSGLAIAEVNGAAVEPHLVHGNYVVASKHPRPWLKQLNLLAGYTYFFNPLRLVFALVRSKSAIPLADRETRPPADVASYSASKRLRRRLYLKARAHVIDAGDAAVWNVWPDAHVPPHVRLGLAAAAGWHPTLRQSLPPVGSRCPKPMVPQLPMRCLGLPLPNRGSRW